MNLYDVIRKPVLSEKSYAGIADKKYTFIVDTNATKIDVKNAVEKIFQVKVESVRTVNYSGKRKSTGTLGRSNTMGKRSAFKKAYVQLTKDSKSIEFFENLA